MPQRLSFIERIGAMPPDRRAALAVAAGRVAAGTEPGALSARLVDRLDPDLLALYLEAQGVAALSGGALRSAALEDAIHRTIERGRRLAADRNAIRGALDAAGLEFIPIKGAWIADRAYPLPEARPMADTDLFVGPDGAAPTASALAALGFLPAETTWKHRVLRRAGDREPVAGVIEHPDSPRPVELHAELRESFRGIDGRPAVRRRDIGRLDAGAGALDDATQAAFVVMHASVGALGRSLRLVSLVDVARLAVVLPRDTWPAVLGLLPGPAGARFLFPALELARRDLGAPLPAPCLSALREQVRAPLAEWVARQTVDGLGIASRDTARRELFEVLRIWPLDAAECAAVWRFALWPRRFQLADRYPRLAGGPAWPSMYGLHVLYTARRLGRRLRLRIRRRL